ncbi:MAG: SAM-dependent DNA methyltransferase [Candidatus Aenigmarchaeota archaeon]|nr:SAM-dependent DNA methyltransferase [Candidatus Aenigmarchaeota archaeon]
MLKADLKTKINQLWDRFWSGGMSNPLTAIEQISYLIFMRRLEDLDTQHQQLAELKGEPYTSVFAGHEDCRWSSWKHLPAQQMLDHVRGKVFPFIKEIRRGEDTQFAEYMKQATFLIEKPSLLQEAVAIIDELNITSQNQDVQGDLYEYLLSELKTSGKNGQFRTPRHIIRLMVGLVSPKLGEKICDPACGTAGFLVNAYEHILKTNTSPDLVKEDEEGSPTHLIGDKITDKRHWDFLRRECLHGFDFEPTMVLIASMNMILHGIEHPNIRRMDALSKSFSHAGQYDVVLANPPFTGSLDTSDLSESFRTPTTKTELLFLELFYNLLAMGGRAAVIVPNGVLFGSSKAHQQVRKLLLEQCSLDAVVSLPSGVFQPYSGVGTAILVFTKGGETKEVWFYEMQADGYSLDQKRTLLDGKGDIPDILQQFKTKSPSPKSFLVPVQQIKDNDYSLSPPQYREVEHEEIEHQDPNALIDDILKLEDDIVKGVKDLKEMIK